MKMSNRCEPAAAAASYRRDRAPVNRLLSRNLSSRNVLRLIVALGSPGPVACVATMLRGAAPDGLVPFNLAILRCWSALSAPSRVAAIAGTLEDRLVVTSMFIQNKQS